MMQQKPTLASGNTLTNATPHHSFSLSRLEKVQNFETHSRQIKDCEACYIVLKYYKQPGSPPEVD